MLVLGIDADTRGLACAAFVGGRFRSVETVARANNRGVVFPGYTAAIRALMLRVQQGGGVVFLEDIYLKEFRDEHSERAKKGVRSFKGLAKVQGEVEHEARRADVQVELVQANIWREAILGTTGSRAVCKLHAERRAMELAAGAASTEHEREAVCIAAYGVEQQGQQVVWARAAV